MLTCHFVNCFGTLLCFLHLWYLVLHLDTIFCFSCVLCSCKWHVIFARFYFVYFIETECNNSGNELILHIPASVSTKENLYIYILVNIYALNPRNLPFAHYQSTPTFCWHKTLLWFILTWIFSFWFSQKELQLKFLYINFVQFNILEIICIIALSIV